MGPSRSAATHLTLILPGSRAAKPFLRQLAITMVCLGVVLYIFFLIAIKLPPSNPTTLTRSPVENLENRQAEVPEVHVDPLGHGDCDCNGDESSKLEKLEKKVLIIGAGLSGAVIGERIAKTCKGYSVTILDQRDHIGGNCFDYIDNETAIRVHKYGAHIFHTSDEGVWQYLSKFTDWTPYEHRVLTKIGTGQLVQVPVNINTVNAVFNANITSEEQMKAWLRRHQVRPPGGVSRNSEETAKGRVGNKLYELLFKHYTKKQWNKYPRELAPTVLERIPVRSNDDGRYFTDKHQALPSKGYTSIFKRMLRSPKIYVKLNAEYFSMEKDGTVPPSDHVFFTGPIDQYFVSAGLPKLEYRSLVFHREVFNTSNGFYLPLSAVNYGTPKIPYTRSIEYAHLPNQEYDPARVKPMKTVVYHETSTDDGEPYYPVPNKRNQDLYAKYQKMAQDEKKVVFVGRLASYKYFDMDDAVRNALNTFENWVRENGLQKDCDLSLSEDFLENKISEAI